MEEQKKQVADKLKGAKNVLVTVSANPSVDQLAACLGLTLSLNKLGKHAAAVFSGEVPSTIEFLKPEDTLEQNTDSLRDFIIALDKSKADKLRYKVEDKVVRIFITPYKTSITQDDLEFSEGDFNVDVVVALGVKDQQDIDQAVTAHGNILHDAAVITMTTSDESGLGAIHWRDPAASGVSEMAASLAAGFEKEVLDEQIATAFLTGIVARTERFSNNLTSSQTMTVAAKLMSAGANQQLVATKLEAPAPAPEPPPEESGPVELPEMVDEEPSTPEPEAKPEDGLGMLEIEHDKSEETKDKEEIPPPPVVPPAEIGPVKTEEPADVSDRILPERENSTTDTDDETEEEEANDLLSHLPPLDQPLLEHDSKKKKSEPEPPEKSKPAPTPPKDEEVPHVEPASPPVKEEEPPTNPSKQTIENIEASVHSPHLEPKPADTDQEESSLPNIHVDENGTLIHQTKGSPDLRPAPGFESSSQPLDTPEQPKPYLQAPDADNKPEDAPPPVPPPIV